MNKLSAVWALFRKGESVADPAAWKTGQITVTLVASLLLAAAHVAEVFGYALPIDQAAADAVAGGIIAVVNIVLTTATSKTVGLPAQPASDATDRPLFPSSNG